MTRGRLPASTLGLTAALLVTIAGCSSSGNGTGASTTSTAVSVQPSSPSPSGPASVSAAPTGASSNSSATPDPSTPVPTSTPTPVAGPPMLRSTCARLMVRIIRGSAAAGREFAALQFTNTGTARCTLHGYPSVTLLLRGKPIGAVSQPSGPRTSTRTLAPGETAESKLNDYTSCQAPLSDSIRVRVPGSSQVSTGTGRLRACTLRVDPLGAPD